MLERFARLGDGIMKQILVDRARARGAQAAGVNQKLKFDLNSGLTRIGRKAHWLYLNYLRVRVCGVHLK